MDQRLQDIKSLQLLRSDCSKRDRLNRELSAVNEKITSCKEVLQKQQDVLKGKYDPFPHYLPEDKAETLERRYTELSKQQAHKRSTSVGSICLVLNLILAIASIIFIIKQPATSWAKTTEIGELFWFWAAHIIICILAVFIGIICIFKQDERTNAR